LSAARGREAAPRWTVAGEVLELRPERAVWLPDHATLLIADPHIGKAVSFRRLGVPVPQGTTSETLAALSDLIAATGAHRLVVLGDFLHSSRAHAPATLEALARWRGTQAALDITLVRGNHDTRAGDPPLALGIEVVDEPLRLGGLVLCHHPQAITPGYVLAGHWHPCIGMGARAHDRLRLPCFWFGDEARHPVGVLPAFGSFTGMHPIEPREGDAIWAVADGAVRRLR
jgi:DNA ligase-associated metallophosphoesterase